MVARDRAVQPRAPPCQAGLAARSNAQVDPLYDRLIAAPPADLRVRGAFPRAAQGAAGPEALGGAGEGRSGRSQPAGLRRCPGPLRPRGRAVVRPRRQGGPGAGVAQSDPRRHLARRRCAPCEPGSRAPLEAIFRDPSRPEDEHRPGRQHPGRLRGRRRRTPGRAVDGFRPEVLRDASSRSSSSRRPGRSPCSRPSWRRSPTAREKEAVTEQAKDQLAERQARAAVALVRLGQAGEVWPLLRHSRRSPAAQLHRELARAPRGRPSRVAAALDRPDSSPRPAERGEVAEGRVKLRPATQNMDAILFHPETSTRRALILALGTYGPDGLSPGEREPLIARLLDLYEHDPDAGIHGASAWTLRQWKQHAEARDDRCPVERQGPGRPPLVRQQLRDRRFVLVEGPVEFRMGSPPDEPDRDSRRDAPPASSSPAVSPSPPRR